MSCSRRAGRAALNGRAQWRVISGLSSSGLPPGRASQSWRRKTRSAADFTPTLTLPMRLKVSQVCASTVLSHWSVAAVATRHTPSGSPPLSSWPWRTR